MAPDPDTTGTLTVTDLGKTWRLQVEWRRFGSRLEPTALTIRTELDGRGLPPPDNAQNREPQQPFPITASAVRRLAIGKHLDTLRRLHDEQQSERDRTPAASGLPHTATQAGWGAAQNGVPLSHELLCDTASAYNEALNAGKSTHAEIANRFNISKSAASKRIMAARRLGLIAPATPGRPRTRQRKDTQQ